MTKRKTPEPIPLEQLVVLRHSQPNNCYFAVVEPAVAIAESKGSLQVHPEEGKWSFDGRKYEVGQSRSTMRGPGEVVGVYDRSNIVHLSSMVHLASAETHTSYSSALDD